MPLAHRLPSRRLCVSLKPSERQALEAKRRADEEEEKNEPQRKEQMFGRHTGPADYGDRTVRFVASGAFAYVIITHASRPGTCRWSRRFESLAGSVLVRAGGTVWLLCRVLCGACFDWLRIADASGQEGQPQKRKRTVRC